MASIEHQPHTPVPARGIPRDLRVTHAKRRCRRCGNALVLSIGESNPPHFYQWWCESRGCGYGLQSVIEETARVVMKAQS